MIKETKTTFFIENKIKGFNFYTFKQNKAFFLRVIFLINIYFIIKYKQFFFTIFYNLTSFKIR